MRAPPRTLRLATVLAGVGGLAFMVRTVERNPTWMSTYVVLNTLAMEHPESYLSLRRRASGLVRVGEPDRAARYYDLAVSLAPKHYGLLTEVAAYLERRQEYGRAEQLLRRAIEVAPDPPTAYRLLANMRLRQGRGREAHAVALQGLAAAGPDRELWSIVSEAYIAKGDLEAAVRARRAALGQDPGSAEDWKRLGDLLEALHRPREAAAARSRARELGEGRPVEKGGIAPKGTGEGG
jgi:tetratricopeptide (TPR) repeat protein